MEIIEYPKKVDLWNCLTHVAGALFSVAGTVLLMLKCENSRQRISVMIFGMSLIAVYTMSSVYHGLPSGEAKRKARLADHCIVPLLIAGTATPCSLITVFNLNEMHGLFVLFVAWGCAVFGIFSKLFFFKKLDILTVCVYIASSIVMLVSVIPLLGQIDKCAFIKILIGCGFYLVGVVFCALGAKKPWLHVVFHVFVLFGSLFHVLAVYVLIAKCSGVC